MDKIITIVIPTYNMEKYLAKCLDSLIVSEDNMRQLEVLIVNDGSKDKSSEIGCSYATKYPGTFRVIDKENGNYGSCVNRGLQEAKGKYIKILDADDSFKNENFDNYISFLKTTDVDMVVSDYDIVDEKGTIIKPVSFELPQEGITSLNSLTTKDSPYIWHQSVAYKTENLRSIGYKQTEGISYTDEEWVFKPMVTVHNIGYFPHTIYLYLRGREGQTYDPAVFKKMFKNIYTVTQSVTDYYAKCKDKVTDEGISRFLSERIHLKLFILYRFYLIKVSNDEGNQLISAFDKKLKDTCPSLYESFGERAFELGFQYIKEWRKNGYERNAIKLLLFRFLYKIAIGIRTILRKLHIIKINQI